ncbi:MAG: cation transporter [Oscillospiraceae bacterium]|nr:cation transporter [Oscillospiraceae bacterium]
MQKIEINISGLQSELCAQAVTNSLKLVDGVESVKVSQKSGVAKVKYDSSKTSINEIVQTIEKQGFDVLA